ncbi:hypothetical protein ATANTOWER_020278 [Ataeniobius toweri]|uniref:Uncharacterized protein n=1 Tax=Ataeniobius toweri TaxID=208326 RepID=A0ABU7C1H4_9TELE|nr:hypothetical protein [Ataeniobius toweri]
MRRLLDNKNLPGVYKNGHENTLYCQKCYYGNTIGDGFNYRTIIGLSMLIVMAHRGEALSREYVSSPKDFAYQIQASFESSQAEGRGRMAPDSDREKRFN